MKLIAQLSLVISLATGALAASTAYHVRLDLPDDQLRGLTLNDDAGRRVAPDGLSEPLLPKGRQLTTLDVELLRDNRVALARVKEFDLRRWPGGPAFLVSVVVMAGCAVWIQKLNRARSSSAAGGGQLTSPADSLLSAEQAVARLVEKVDGTDQASTQLQLILAGLGAIGQEQMAAFLEAQPRLKEDLGLGGAAEVMGQFATAERQAHRAWSAAADGHDEEAIQCLRAARRLLHETAETLARLQPADTTG